MRGNLRVGLRMLGFGSLVIGPVALPRVPPQTGFGVRILGFRGLWGWVSGWAI